MKLATIGYQGLSVSSFFDLLLDSQVETLIDIREIPLSRKPGFSKGALKKQAQLLDLRYIHLGNLGCPREIRQDYKEDGDWERYTRRFLAYLDKQSREIERLLDIIFSESCCLLCFEADPDHCHRCYVAKAAQELAIVPLEIIHLGEVRMPVGALDSWAGISTRQ